MNTAPLSLLLFAGIPPTPLAVPESASGATTRATGAIEIVLDPYVGPLRTLKAKIGDAERPMLFDTGGGYTVLSTASAQSAGSTPFGRGTGFRHDGTRSDGQRGTPIDISIGGFTRRGEVGVIDLDRMLQGLPPVAGIASLETFAGERITVDLARNRLFVESDVSLAARVQQSREVTMRIARQAGGAALDVFVAIEGKHGFLWFELDSGNVAPVLVAPHAFEELGIEAPPRDKTRTAELPLPGFGPVKCEIASKEMIYDGLLNADFFLRHVVTLDLERSRAWLRAGS